MSEIRTYIDSDGFNITEWNAPPNIKHPEYAEQLKRIFAANGKKIEIKSTLFESGINPATGERENPDKNIITIQWTLK